MSTGHGGAGTRPGGRRERTRTGGREQRSGAGRGACRGRPSRAQGGANRPPGRGGACHRMATTASAWNPLDAAVAYWDRVLRVGTLWQTRRGGTAAIDAACRSRLRDLIEFTRARSRCYRDAWRAAAGAPRSLPTCHRCGAGSDGALRRLGDRSGGHPRRYRGVHGEPRADRQAFSWPLSRLEELGDDRSPGHLRARPGGARDLRRVDRRAVRRSAGHPRDRIASGRGVLLARTCGTGERRRRPLPASCRGAGWSRRPGPPAASRS